MQTSPVPECILVVEDDLIIASMIEQVLAFEGYQVVHVADGQAAVEGVEHHHPDLVLMDLMLPVMSGVEACRAIKTNTDSEISQIPIVAMSAGTNLRQATTEMCADGFLPKPFDIDTLVATVHLHTRS